VDGEGNPVVLRGFGLGGWMNMENFITGYPANEEAQREAVRAVLGRDLYEHFFDRFLEHFFTEGDVVMEPLKRLFATEYPYHDPFPFGTHREIELLVRNILLAEPMLKEHAELFRGMDEAEIDGMMRSFRFENCVRREELAGILADHSLKPAGTGQDGERE